MASLMLVNPRKRRRTTTKKRRTTSHRRAAAPRRRRRNPIAAAPVRRRRRRRASPVAVRRRRNPIGRKKGMVEDLLMPSLIAGAGALGVDVVAGFIPIPPNFLAGPVSYVTKGALAIGFGMLAGMVTNKHTAKQLTIGALTVTAHGMLRDAASKAMPSLNLGYYNAAMPAGMGMYQNGGSYAIGQPTAPALPQSANPGMGMYDYNAAYSES